MVTRLDNRQSRQRSVLDQISDSTDLKLDNILSLMNDELTMPLRLRANSTPNLVLNVGAISVTTSDSGEGHQRTKTIQPIQGLIPTFTGGTLTFPASSGGAVTGSGITLSAAFNLTISSGNWRKVLLSINSDGVFTLSAGTEGASEVAASLPEADSGTLAIGYVAMQNIGGVIQNVTNARVYQFVGGGGGAGSGSSGTYRNYFDVWFTGDKDVGTVSSGTVSSVGNRTAPDAAWATPNAAQISIARINDSNVLFGNYSYQVTGTGFNVDGVSVFLETPVFTFKKADYTVSGGALNKDMYFYFECNEDLGITSVALVKYNSSGVFQSMVPVKGAFGADADSNGALLSSGGGRFYCYIESGLVVDSGAKFAFRFRRAADPSGAVKEFEGMYFGPSMDVSSNTQIMSGEKVFADEMTAKQGMNIDKTLNFSGTLTVAANETKMVGKLNVASGTTIDVSASTSVLVCVGAIEGDGLLTGSGTIVSI